jgi:hypothetical protein
MRLSPLNAYERETIIVMNDDEATATITTHQRRILTKLERNPRGQEDRGSGPRKATRRQIQPPCAVDQHPQQEKGWNQGKPRGTAEGTKSPSGAQQMKRKPDA